MIDTQELNRAADITTVLSYYGIHPNRAGFINCIAHKDSRPSMKVYTATNSVHCFSCGADFNSIGVVMKIENCTFPQACDRLRSMFGLSDDRRGQAEIKRKMQAIAEEKRRQKEAEQERRNEFIFWCELKHRLERDLQKIVPQPLTDDFRENCEMAMVLAIEIIEIEKILDDLIFERGEK